MTRTDGPTLRPDRGNGRTAQFDVNDHLLQSEAITAPDVSAYRWSPAVSCDRDKSITLRRRFSMSELPVFAAVCSPRRAAPLHLPLMPVRSLQLDAPAHPQVLFTTAR
jgi:hypothetical protein